MTHYYTLFFQKYPSEGLAYLSLLRDTSTKAGRGAEGERCLLLPANKIAITCYKKK